MTIFLVRQVKHVGSQRSVSRSTKHVTARPSKARSPPLPLWSCPNYVLVALILAADELTSTLVRRHLQMMPLVVVNGSTITMVSIRLLVLTVQQTGRTGARLLSIMLDDAHSVNPLSIFTAVAWTICLLSQVRVFTRIVSGLCGIQRFGATKGRTHT